MIRLWLWFTACRVAARYSRINKSSRAGGVLPQPSPRAGKSTAVSAASLLVRSEEESPHSLPSGRHPGFSVLPYPRVSGLYSVDCSQCGQEVGPVGIHTMGFAVRDHIPRCR